MLTTVSGYSRWLTAPLLPTGTAENQFTGWSRLLDGSGRAPRLLVWDYRQAYWTPGHQAPSCSTSTGGAVRSGILR